MRVDIEPDAEGSTLTVSLRIVAKNGTDAEIPLTRPYVLPVPFAQDVAARDAAGHLRTTMVDDKPAIRFPDRPPIAPHGEYAWDVSFKRRVSEHIRGNMLLFRYLLKAQNDFQGRRVHSHCFDCTFRFVKPRDDRWRRLKVYKPLLRDDRKLISRVVQEADATTCQVDGFHVGERDPSPALYFVCVYGFAGWWAPLVASMLTLLAAVTLEKILEIVLF
ncbi:MAG TPA: hypothetical protein VHG91_15680 [Longimicrobium sp.]|nr:hypothetical protein [Longimicrobium sp.]